MAGGEGSEMRDRILLSVQASGTRVLAKTLDSWRESDF